MNREDVAMDVTVQNVEILRGRLEQAAKLLREIRPTIPKDVLELWCADRDDFLASQQEEQVNFDIERMEKAIAFPYHVIPEGLDADGLREWMSSIASKHPEQADGAQGEREACAECSGSGKVYDVSGDGPWTCYACANTSEVVGYANGDELDNMLDDRTAVLSPVKTGFHTVPVYRRARAALAQPSPSKSCTKPDCFPHCDCGSADDKAQPSPAPELERPEVAVKVLISPDMKHIFVPSLPDDQQPRVAEFMAHWMVHWIELAPAPAEFQRQIEELSRRYANTLGELNRMREERDAAQARVAELENADGKFQWLIGLIDEECKYWHKYGDENRRAVLANILSAANAAPNKSPVAQAGQVPEGWKLMPIEPTEDIIYAIHFAGYVGSIQELRDFYQAVLAAAPAQGE